MKPYTNRMFFCCSFIKNRTINAELELFLYNFFRPRQ